MISPPGVVGRRGPVHGPLHESKERLSVLAGPIAFPPVLPVHVHLIVEGVVDRDSGPSGCVDPLHVLTELGSMSVSVSVVLGHEQQGMDHLMEKSLHQVPPWSKL